MGYLIFLSYCLYEWILIEGASVLVFCWVLKSGGLGYGVGDFLLTKTPILEKENLDCFIVK